MQGARQETAQPNRGIAKSDGWGDKTAKQLSQWDPYDQNASAPFFDPEWMFGVREGFDVVIGNPPYGSLITEEQKRRFNAIYRYQSYQLDSYLLFLERCHELSVLAGSVALIIPNTWLLNLFSKELRRWIFTNKTITAIVHFTTSVFTAVVNNEVVILSNASAAHDHRVRVIVYDDEGAAMPFMVPQERWKRRDGQAVNVLERPEFSQLADRLRAFPLLDSVCVITQGGKPFQVGKGKPPQTRTIVDRKPFVSTRKENKSFRPLLRGSLIQRYAILWDNDYWISFGDWLAEPRYSASYDAPEKVVVRQTGDSLVATLDNKQFIVRDNLYTIVARGRGTDLRFVFGLLNSTILNWFYQKALNPEEGEALAQVKRGHVAELPVAPANGIPATELVKLVTLTLSAKAEDPAADTMALEREIDEIVYRLYGLTEEEIAIVEGAAGKGEK